MAMTLDPIDQRILEQLQRDAALSNHDLAGRVHVSPATALRRVRRLIETGVIERQVALLSPDTLGATLTAIVEVTLEAQSAEALAAFEAAVTTEATVQQCYRVTSGPDFVLVTISTDMAAYHALAARLFTQALAVRNVRTFFSVKRVKFGTEVPLG
ncbi:MAG: Lrp/AsnC family transcriptional regulator [Burkholderiaceae bacterium]